MQVDRTGLIISVVLHPPEGNGLVQLASATKEMTCR